MPYRLYVDEVGNDDLTNVSNDNHRFLSLTGVAVHHDHIRDYATPKLNAIKGRLFRQDPDRPVILHRSDIVGKKGPFGVLRDPQVCQQFDDALIQYLLETDFTVITAVIDKKLMLTMARWRQNHPYHYLLEILVEKYSRWLQRKHDTGDIMPEKRYGIKDRELEKAYERIRVHGSYWASATTIARMIPSSALKLRPKSDNITGLQIADLVAHPSYINVRKRMGHQVTPGPFAQRIIGLLQLSKYDRSSTGRIIGYGTKYLP